MKVQIHTYETSVDTISNLHKSRNYLRSAKHAHVRQIFAHYQYYTTLHRWEDDIKMDCSGSGYGQVAAYCERGDELSRSTKWREFLELLRNYHLIEKDSAPRRYLVTYLASCFTFSHLCLNALHSFAKKKLCLLCMAHKTEERTHSIWFSLVTDTLALTPWYLNSTHWEWIFLPGFLHL